METPQPPHSDPKTGSLKKSRTRVGRKRSNFEKAPKPAWPVRGLWESAPLEEKTRAHQTCMRILEYWLGKKDKAQIAREMEITPLRVWQLSQQALSGMMAGLLRQPRRRVGKEVFEKATGMSVTALRRRITELEKELSRTEDLVRVLRTAPWLNPQPESPPKGGARHGPNGKPKKSSTRRKTPNRKSPPREGGLQGNADGAG